jgi:hypothetical protein
MRPERDEQATVARLEAMIADLGGQQGTQSPNPESEADALLAKLAAWG